jgi:branched-chain amino acid transport system ATP-binding protein
LLEIHDLHVSYGTIPAVRGISLSAAPGERIAIVGRNGAGKSSMLRAIAGISAVASGSICFNGTDMTTMSAPRRAASGIALVPEGRGLFSELTVRDNLAMGAYHLRRSAGDVAKAIERVTEPFPRMRERLGQVSGSLSGGEQQMLVVARALMSEPKLLMLDEPSLGLSPILVDEVYALLGSLVAQGITVIVVEQYVHIALKFSERALVLDKGRVAIEGSSAELNESDGLARVYMAAG